MCYAVVLDGGVDGQFSRVFVATVLGINILGTWALRRVDSPETRWFLTVADIVSVAWAMMLIQNAATDFFLTFLVVLTFSAVSHGAIAAATMSLLVSGIYGAVLYTEVGILALTDQQYLMRVAFLFAVGFFYSNIAAEAKRHRGRAEHYANQMQSVATHAKNLARDKYRLRALSEIGRLGLAGPAAANRDVLYEISKRLQKGMGVDRCSLVIFGDETENKGYLAASSDDEGVEVQVLSVESYPELQETLASGEITEVHPNNPPELWERVESFLPNASHFKSFLVVPIKAGERVFGAFYLRDHEAERSFDEEARDFCWASAMMTASFIRGRDLLDQLRHQSRVDGLTGLLNFQAFTEELNRELKSRDAEQLAPYSLVVIDLDGLKQVNDSHGHAAGNRAITELGRRLEAALPTAIAMCRYGGDEFVALVPASRSACGDQLSVMLSELTAMAWDEAYEVCASIGVAEYPTDAFEVDALLEAADQAMYRAKGSGGHQIRDASGTGDQGEGCDSVVSVQTRRTVAKAIESFDENLCELQRRVMLGLQAPVVRESITALMDAVEMLDPPSKHHSVYVSELCRGLASRLGLSADEVLRTEIAGHLHDVGKIKLPPELHGKTGGPTDDERALIQQLPTEGAQILESLPGLRRVAELVLLHQERWDGSGYPNRVAGDDVPIGAQIVGICDVYDTLVTPRPHRPAMDRSRARQLIEQEIGRLWSPSVAHPFLAGC